MKTYFLSFGLLAFMFLFGGSISAQTNVARFDGQNDYIDLAAGAGNGIRTVECWFRPAVQINSSINDYIALVARNVGFTTNEHEFDISFSPISGTKGRLEWRVEDAFGNPHFVYSDSTVWQAGRWYHVAGVVHPSLGMMIFVDGIKQQSTNSYANATGVVNNVTSLGCWGDYRARFFHGDIEDVRFSTTALYTTNFTPPCPDIPILSSTKGVWHFNSTSPTFAFDSTSSALHGTLFGAIKDTATVCKEVSCDTESVLDTTVCDSFSWAANEATYYQSGTYTFTTLNKVKCDSNMILNLTVITVDDGISVNQDTLTSAQDSASYQWLDCERNVIVGSNQQTYVPAQTGFYAVIVNHKGCEDTSNCVFMDISSSDWVRFGIEVYPNPFEDMISPSFDQGLGQGQVSMLDIRGRTIVRQTLTLGGVQHLPVSVMPGMYVLELTLADQRKLTYKLVKQ